MLSPGNNDELEWITLTSLAENFEVLMPTAWSREFYSLLDGADDGVSPATIVYQSKGMNIPSSGKYQVSVTRVREFYGSREDFLYSALDMLINNIDGGELKSKELGHLQGSAALYFRVEVVRHGAAVKIRGVILSNGNTLYTLKYLWFRSPKSL
jgi:hypothetical protein